MNIASKGNIPQKNDGCVRLLHFSDIHISLHPSLRDLLFTKRILGYLNHLVRRRHRLHLDYLQKLAELMPELQPDAVLCTGDLSSIGLATEFQAAEKLLEPFRQHNLIYIPGNHDRYVNDDSALDALRQTFRRCNPQGGNGDLSSSGGFTANTLELDALPEIIFIKGLALLLLNPARPVPYHLSCGILDSAMEGKLIELLASIPPDMPRAIACHFPPLMPNGALAGWRHGLRGADYLADMLKTGQVDAILSGHEHKPFLLKMPGGQSQLCAGSITLEGSYTICDFPLPPPNNGESAQCRSL